MPVFESQTEKVKANEIYKVTMGEVLVLDLWIMGRLDSQTFERKEISQGDSARHHSDWLLTVPLEPKVVKAQFVYREFINLSVFRRFQINHGVFVLAR
jgi:hypothetical protein